MPSADVRVGFLYNHDQIHQIAHSLPVALALSRRDGVQVIVAVTSLPAFLEIERIAGAEALERIVVVRLELERTASKVATALVNRIVPARRVLVLRDNRAFFRTLDALVVTERTSLILKQRFGLSDLKMILIDHGAGDRAIGFGPSLRGYDHILAAGPKIRDRMIADAGVDPDRITLVGYPKFDMGIPEALSLPMLENGRTTVLYNPHPAPHLSSWYRMGQQILDYFRNSDRYNLIFAPHAMLFNRSVVITIDQLHVGFPGRVPLRHFAAPNIHIDLGSRFCSDMSFTRMADIYLGDVSSQVYEFLRVRRPCMFLNPHRRVVGVDPNYAHWAAGPVIEDMDAFDAGLARATADFHSHYRPKQDALFDYTFDMGEHPASVRAADAIARLIAT